MSLKDRCMDCGHTRDFHAKKTQGCTYLFCEYSDCNCEDFIGFDTIETLLDDKSPEEVVQD